jgi:subtilisin family serine protease
LAVSGLAAAAPTASAGSTASAKTAAPTSKAFSAGRYIVTFADEPAATYEGGIAGYARTRPAAGAKLDPTRTEVIRYRARLAQIHDAALSAVGANKIYDYSVTTNGVAVDLTASQARGLSANPGVVSFEKDARRQITTTLSPEFLGLSAQGGLWEQLGGNTTAGRGVIVGVLDTGIWPESASFAGGELKRDKAGLPVASSGLRGKWFGACVQGELFNSQDCNDKLIGARYYVAGFGRRNLAEAEYVSPRDGNGHGSHTTSTAAGNRVADVQIDGFVQGTASGMAPGARVAAYKVCWTGKTDGGCANSDSVAAIDDAVADGVDVINYSVGSTTESSVLDSVEQAYRRAANVGVFVANSAGNSGPGASTLDHPSPWLTTVAASTHRSPQKALLLGNGSSYVGASITSTLPEKPLVTSVAVKLASASAGDAALCFPGTLDPAKTAGKLVQCDRGAIARIDKSFEVKRAGGVGMVLINTAPGSLNSDFHPVPTVHLDHNARTPVQAYITSAGAGATGSIVEAGGAGAAVPEVAAFSSRGPSTTTGGDILKPDIAAPGVDVLAAVAPPSNHGRSYDYLSGTSMSSPHVAGIAALIKAAHPNWSPMAVKSALMTSARDHVTTTDVFAQGAGFVQPNKGVDPGLVFDSQPNDWRRYMVSLGVRFGGDFASLNSQPVAGPDLNQASLAIGAMAGTRTVTRTVTNVSGAAESYTVSETVPGIDIVATPATFTIPAGGTQAISLRVTRDDAPLDRYAKGSLTLTSSAHSVRIPVAVRPVAVSAPSEISGATTGDGSKTFSVTPSFTGTLQSSANGLLGATPVAGSVVTGGFDFTAPTTSAATKKYELNATADTKLLRFDLDAASASDDLDLYVYRDGEFVAYSASGAADEQVTIPNPTPGHYEAYVNGFATGGGGAYTHTAWAVAQGAVGNLAVDPAAASATVGEPVTLTATWSSLESTKRYLGFIGYTGAPDITIVSVG